MLSLQRLGADWGHLLVDRPITLPCMERKRKCMLSGLLLALVVTSYGQVGPIQYAVGYRDAVWISKRGFPVSAYDWQNETINQQLTLAARYRRQSNRCWRYGGLAYLAGGLAATGIAIGSFGVPSGQMQPYEHARRATAIVVTGGLITALGGGIWRKEKARRRAREALHRYQRGTRY